MRSGNMARKQVRDKLTAHSAALLGDGVVHPPFYLEEHGRVGPVFIKAKAKLEAVFVAVDRAGVEREVVRIEVKAVDRIGKVGKSRAKLVNFQIRSDEGTGGQSDILRDDVLQLEPRGLHLVFAHNKGQTTARA